MGELFKKPKLPPLPAAVKAPPIPKPVRMPVASDQNRTRTKKMRRRKSRTGRPGDDYAGGGRSSTVLSERLGS